MAIKRAGLPIKYSQGFNPHQLISFALPLPLGMDSQGEYTDIKLTAQANANDIISQLNPCLPTGIKITAARELLQGEKSCSSAITAAEYSITLPQINIEPICASIMNAETINMQIKTKSGEKIVNIRPLIVSINASNPLTAILKAGSAQNLKPEYLLKYIQKNLGESIDAKITRQEMYKTIGGLLLPLIS